MLLGISDESWMALATGLQVTSYYIHKWFPYLWRSIKWGLPGLDSSRGMLLHLSQSLIIRVCKFWHDDGNWTMRCCVSALLHCSDVPMHASLICWYGYCWWTQSTRLRYLLSFNCKRVVFGDAQVKVNPCILHIVLQSIPSTCYLYTYLKYLTR